MTSIAIWRLNRQSGSITVFLTFVFVIMFSLVIAVIDNARVISSRGYMKTASDCAVRSVLGNYCKELYEDYRLFGYGGFDGSSCQCFTDEYRNVLGENCAYNPSDKFGYSNLYRISDMEIYLKNVSCISEGREFIRQQKQYVKMAAVKETMASIKEKVNNTKNDFDEEAFSEADKYERGEYEEKEGFDKDKGDNKAGSKKCEYDDTAGGNPLDALKELVEDGILSLVCDLKEVTDTQLEFDRDGISDNNDTESQEQYSSAASFIKEFINNNLKHDEYGDDEKNSDDVNVSDKIVSVAYGKDMFSNYSLDRKKTIRYGMEYLVAGKNNEKSNLVSVVERLLAMRMAINFTYIYSDKELKGKSMATAMTIAGITGIEPVANAIQYTILAILAFEEACVDVCALLDGKSVPLVKNKDNFKMKYEEICLCSRQKFQRKAEEYDDAENILKGYVTYEEYLCFFMLMVSENNINNRMLNLIQLDMREKYNQTFSVDACITSVKCRVKYYMPIIYGKLFDDNTHKGNINREVTVFYEYE